MMKKNRIGVYEKAIPETYSVCEALEFAKKAGFDFYEINIDRTDNRISRVYDKAFASEIRNASIRLEFPIESLGLSALSTYTLGNDDPETEHKAIDIFEHTLEFAANIGARIIQVPACDVPKGHIHTKETDERFLKNISYAARLASSYGILLGLENMEDDYMNTIGKCSRIINTVASPYLKYYPDCGNIKRAFPSSPCEQWEDISIARGNMISMHLKETRNEKYGGLFYGEGDVDFQAAVKCALSEDVHRFMMEYWYTGNENWEDDLFTACKLAHSWIDKATP